ncbi:MAG: thermonuclease family protein [Planctomycetes bacterium]|nr:thermonuclease family protein [Planctomycetota bacterium]
MRMLLAFSFLLSAAAVETVAVPVLRVVDGDTIEVTAEVDGASIVATVRLLYVACPTSVTADAVGSPAEPRLATEALRALLPIGAQVVLSAPGETFVRDGEQRMLAVVSRRDGGEPAISINLSMIRAGWSPYWRKNGDAQPDEHAKLQLAEADADRARAGYWATAREWMLAKGAERTPPTASEQAPQAPSP